MLSVPAQWVSSLLCFCSFPEGLLAPSKGVLRPLFTPQKPSSGGTKGPSGCFSLFFPQRLKGVGPRAEIGAGLGQGNPRGAPGRYPAWAGCIKLGLGGAFFVKPTGSWIMLLGFCEIFFCSVHLYWAATVEGQDGTEPSGSLRI